MNEKNLLVSILFCMIVLIVVQVLNLYNTNTKDVYSFHSAGLHIINQKTGESWQYSAGKWKPVMYETQLNGLNYKPYSSDVVWDEKVK